MSKYTGNITGFQVIATIDDEPLSHIIANDVYKILKNLTDIYDIEKLYYIQNTLAQHSGDINNPHNIEIIGLSKDILLKLYEAWIEEGHNTTYDEFITILFNYIEIIEEPELQNDEYYEKAISVKNLHKFLWYYHTGPFYVHENIMDTMFIGLVKEGLCPVLSFDTFPIDLIVDLQLICLTIELKGLKGLSSANEILYFNLKHDTEDLIKIYKKPNNNHLVIDILDGTNVDTATISTLSNDLSNLIVSISPLYIRIGYLLDVKIVATRNIIRRTKHFTTNKIANKIFANRINTVSLYNQIMTEENVKYLTI